MATYEKFIKEKFEKYRIMKYLEDKLERVGLADIDIQRTPLVTRINLAVMNPAMIIGKKGRLINELTQEIKNEFNIENPQINVIEVTQPYLEPRIVGRKAAHYIEMGKKVRAVLHFLLKEIMKSGALGAEIRASGKIGAKGAKARSLRVSAGYIPKAGEVTRAVKEAHVTANTKSGIIGILIRIVPPGTVFPDKQPTEAIPLPRVVAAAETVDEGSSKVQHN
jgi:small subunit ribosomal protein S3